MIPREKDKRNNYAMYSTQISGVVAVACSESFVAFIFLSCADSEERFAGMPVRLTEHFQEKSYRPTCRQTTSPKDNNSMRRRLSLDELQRRDMRTST